MTIYFCHADEMWPVLQSNTERPDSGRKPKSAGDYVVNSTPELMERYFNALEEFEAAKDAVRAYDWEHREETRQISKRLWDDRLWSSAP